VLLDISWGSAVPGAVAVGGAAHPLGGAGGARRGSDSAHRRRLNQEKGGTADRRRRPLPPGRRLGPSGISHAARAQLGGGDDASAPLGLAGPVGQCSTRFVALPQRDPRPAAHRALSLPQCPGPRDERLCGGSTSHAADSCSQRGGYATQDSRHQFPAMVPVGGRRLSTGKLSALSPQPRGPRRGCPPKTGPLVGRRKRLPANGAAGNRIPPEAGALVQGWTGLWQTVLPGRVIRVVGLRRPMPPAPPAQATQPPSLLEVFFTPDLPWSPAMLLAQSRDRWAVEITIRESPAFAGFGQGQGRKRECVVGATT
jgi:hypothetical protein